MLLLYPRVNWAHNTLGFHSLAGELLRPFPKCPPSSGCIMFCNSGAMRVLSVRSVETSPLRILSRTPSRRSCAMPCKAA